MELLIDNKTVYTDYIKIDNLEQYLTKVPLLHPDSPQYNIFWSRETKRCIEGLWGEMFGGFRYMPGNLYYYGNYTLIQQTDKNKTTRYIKPRVDDIEWEFAYMSLEAKGFSGWSKDDTYTSLELVKELNDAGVFEPNEYILENYQEAITADGKLKTYIPPRENIRKIHTYAKGRPYYHNPTHNIGILGCLAKNVSVRMYDGSVKVSQDVQIGDLLMGPDSNPREVTELIRGEHMIYKVSTRYGEDYSASYNHILYLNYHDKHKGLIRKELTIGEFLDIPEEDRKRYYSGIMAPCIQYPTKDLYIDPYFIGLWLGDGFKREKLIVVSEDDHEILEWLTNYASSEKRFSYTTTGHSGGGLGTKALTRFRLIDNTLLYKNNWWSTTFRNNKHIPYEYATGDENQRLKLLAGFIDSDGSYEKGRFTITNVDLPLLQQIQDVARSLGFRSVIHKPTRTGITNSLKYNLRITGDISRIPTLVKRKQAVDSTLKKGSNKNDITVTPIGIESFYGFEVTGDRLYCLGDYSITHNSRGGGKSFYTALAEVEHGIIFDGSKEYTEEFIKGLITAEFCIGSANADKSSELASKIDSSIRAKASPDLGRQFGVWGKEDDDDFTPCPFYKDMTGSIATNNKKNPYRHEYKVELNGRWVTKGTGTKLYHVNYSTKKGDGAQAAAGGRYLVSVEEEWGLEENAIEVHNSNDSTVARDGVFFGVQWKMGTSGNIEYIQSTKKMFLNPKDYRIVSFKNQHGNEGQDGNIGFFLPFYMVLRQYKDKNGNTDYEAAVAHVNKIRAEKTKSTDPKVLRDEKMNRPCFVDEMWVTDKTYYLPYEEAQQREKELMAFGKYKTLEKPVKLIWDSLSPRGVRYEIDHNAEPYREFPIDFSKRKDPSGCIVIYDMPHEINGDIPPDMYQFVGLDPYVEENIDGGGSIGACFILTNPKYIPHGARGNCIAATYIGKPTEGLTAYYEGIFKLMSFYNCGPGSLWFEKNRGDACREYFIRKNRADMLCVTPQFVMGSNIYQKRMLSFGYVVGNKVAKINLLKTLNDWLLDETELHDGKKKNIERIPCLFTLRQIMQYDIDGNFDAVDGLRGAVIGLKEYSAKIEAGERQQVSTSGRFNYILNNPKIFKNARAKRFYEANRT